MIGRKTNRRHMTGDHHGQTPSRATPQVTAANDVSARTGREDRAEQVVRVGGLVLLLGKRPVDHQRLPREVLKVRSAGHHALVGVPLVAYGGDRGHHLEPQGLPPGWIGKHGITRLRSSPRAWWSLWPPFGACYGQSLVRGAGWPAADGRADAVSVPAPEGAVSWGTLMSLVSSFALPGCSAHA